MPLSCFIPSPQPSPGGEGKIDRTADRSGFYMYLKPTALASGVFTVYVLVLKNKENREH
jgi:hypothetical protein